MEITGPNGKLFRSYRKWSSMLQRCYNPRHPAYKYYGGRGIDVCSRWRGKGGYEHFVCDMGEPLDGFTLGRKKNDLGYSPDNCQWETMKEQVANRRPKRCNPDSLHAKAKAAGLPYQLVYQRVAIHQWPLKLALSTPAMGRGDRRNVKRGPKWKPSKPAKAAPAPKWCRRCGGHHISAKECPRYPRTKSGVDLTADRLD